MNSDTLRKFGQRVRQERLKRNLSQEQLAELAGVHRTYVGMVERAEKNITLNNIEKIAQSLSMQISELFSENWVRDIVEFCDLYNVPIEFLGEIMRDPKVIPMIRGKAFEFHVFEYLSNFLPASDWTITKPFLNPQQGEHDSDVKITHNRTETSLTVECKLAKKGSYKCKNLSGQKIHTLEVKCMRSRTLGEEKVKQLAPIYNVSKEVLKIHNDQYLPRDFSLVVTSIGNAFYETDSSGVYIWKPTDPGERFLRNLQSIYQDSSDLQDFAFSRMYVAKSFDIAVMNNGVKCSRRKCQQKDSCGFIPNYPTIQFADGRKFPLTRWIPIEESLQLFQDSIN